MPSSPSRHFCRAGQALSLHDLLLVHFFYSFLHLEGSFITVTPWKSPVFIFSVPFFVGAAQEDATTLRRRKTEDAVVQDHLQAERRLEAEAQVVAAGAAPPPMNMYMAAQLSQEKSVNVNGFHRLQSCITNVAQYEYYA